MSLSEETTGKIADALLEGWQGSNETFNENPTKQEKRLLGVISKSPHIRKKVDRRQSLPFQKERILSRFDPFLIE